MDRISFRTPGVPSPWASASRRGTRTQGRQNPDRRCSHEKLRIPRHRQELPHHPSPAAKRATSLLRSGFATTPCPCCNRRSRPGHDRRWSRNRDSSVAMSSMKRSAKGSRCGSPPRSVKDSIIAEPRSGNAGGPAGGTIERGPRPRADGQDIRASGRLPGAARQEEIRGARVAHHARNFAICRNSMARHRDIPPACHGNICGSAFCGGASRAPGRTAPARRAGRKGHPRSPIRGAPGTRDTPPAARPPGRAIVGPAAPMAAFHLNRRTRGNTARNSPRSGRDTA